MPYLHINIDGDGVWPDLQDKEVIHVTEGFHIAALEGGMESGNPSMAIRVDLPDGLVVVAENSLKNFLVAAAVFIEKFGDR